MTHLLDRMAFSNVERLRRSETVGVLHQWR